MAAIVGARRRNTRPSPVKRAFIVRTRRAKRFLSTPKVAVTRHGRNTRRSRKTAGPGHIPSRIIRRQFPGKRRLFR